MARSPKPYRRLPGGTSSAFEYLRLYQASDHLLLVASSGFNESYRRFFFRDIQALTLRRTKARMWWNIVFGVPLGLCVLMLLIGAADISQRTFQPDDLGPMVALSIPALIFLLFILVNTLRGPTCVCEIQTAVQARRLPTLGRLNRARKVIAQLKPLIEAAQEPLPPEGLARRIDAARQGAAVQLDAPPVIPAPIPGEVSSGQIAPPA